MNFYHILPSNASPDYFPNNNASEYSTPLENPYVLPGEWEVGLMDLTYSTCVNTFNDDKIFVEHDETIAEVVAKSKKPLKVMLPVPTNQSDVTEARKELIAYITEKFKTLLRLTLSVSELRCYWTLITKKFYFIISPGIQTMFQLWSDVVTLMDLSIRNPWGFYKKFIPSERSDVYIIIVPVKPTSQELSVTYTLKKANETITPEQLLQRFEKQVKPGIVKLTLDNKKFCLKKLHNDTNLTILNKHLRGALNFNNAGIYRAGNVQYKSNLFKDWMKSKWTFTIITLNDIEIFNESCVTLPPASFEEESDAIRFINSKVNDERIKFSCNTAKHITLTIATKKLTVKIDDALRDIFAFDKNSFTGDRTYTASGVFSLTRCIQFLYIYSNIGDFVHVGNTEAPLLAIVPFSKSKGCSLLKERIFKTPMYIHVARDRISQIDVGIYDGAGQLVPFASNTVTTLRLHFRQL